MSDPTAEQPPPGTPTAAGRVGDDFRSLRRSSSDRVVAGVLGGLGRRLDIDPVVLRVATAVLAVFGGVGVLLYALAWLLVPAEDQQGSVLDQALGRRDARPGGAIPLSILLTAIILVASGNIVGGSWDGGVLFMLAAIGLVALLRRHRDDADADAADPGYQPPQFDATMPYWPAPDHPAADPQPSSTGAEPSPASREPAAAGSAAAAAGSGPTTTPEAAAKPPRMDATSAPAAETAPSVTESIGTTSTGTESADGQASGTRSVDAESHADPSTDHLAPATPASPGASTPGASTPGAPTPGAPTPSPANPSPESSASGTSAAPIGPGLGGDTPRTPASGGPGWPEGPDWGSTAVGWGPYDAPSPVTAAPPPAPRPRSILGPLTVSAALVAVGALAINDVYWASVPAAMYIAVALAVVGIGLLLGTWFGRSRGLIVLGIALCVALVPATFVGRFGPTIQDTTVTFTTAAELPTSPVEYGIGDITYDLSALALPEGEPATLAVELGTGSLTVIVPPDVDVTVNAATGMGEVTAFDESAGGFGQERTFTDVGADGPGGGELQLDLEVGMGEVKVIR